MTEQIEVVYDRLVAREKLKAGAKYERLAAIVFTILENATTVHDLRLVGEVGVPHQIDAVVGTDRRRILVEAKDYERKVTLPVVRDFSMVVHDLRPSAAYVVTTVGFSDNAVKWANAHGIKLAILRPPVKGTADEGKLLQAIHNVMRFSTAAEPRITWFVPKEEAGRFAEGSTPIGFRALDDMALGALDSPQSIRPFIEPLLQAETDKIPPGEAGVASGSYNFDEPTWLHLPSEGPLRVTGLSWTQEMVASTHEFTVGFGFGGLTAELMLRTLDGETHRIFSNRQIEAVNFDGKITRPGAD